MTVSGEGREARRIAVVDAWPHAAMILVMVVVMVGPLGAIGALLGVGALVGCSIGCAARARSSALYRAHLVDLWAMALLLLALLPPAHVAADETMTGMSMPAFGSLTGSGGALIGCALIVTAWLVTRAMLAHRSSRPLHDLLGGLVTGCGLVVMALV